ncbi:hypothetical protein AAU57_04695 [Nonlabens sp. YIK11]|uniref:GIY-YIG nuclease family protein n=1 Tax=Nonlabens sp. YIK11 TaxID=1453349 RepID=UPI0006DCAD83|nr:GIY-YIG nuclease family protein [Nonlabens sp. YIK11]KQC32694.1 hypothetical protein AAU57_04695 [Nonlabens sp. YIK11]
MCIRHFVYVIHSKAIDCYYKGYSQHPENRLAQHNAAQSKFTSRANDKKLVFKEEFPTKNEALTREKVI